MASLDTIYALSSGRLPAGIAVVRVSGPKAGAICTELLGRLPQPRHATYGSFRSADGNLIDRGIVLFFPGPSSSTAEDLVEFHLHGGKATVAALYNAIGNVVGTRPAEPGEFTLRAFAEGKIDLLQAEALADLVEAETESQRRAALRNADGAQSALYAEWRERLLTAQAMIAAELDFSDEDDVPAVAADAVWTDLAGLNAEMRAHCAGFARSEMIRDGYDVVISGPPNAGKSSLFNAMLRREAAIVSPEPGTTRDLVEAVLDIDGMKVRLTDTAGIRSSPGLVEAMGIDRALKRVREADLVLQVHDLSSGHSAPSSSEKNVLAVGTKSDMADKRAPVSIVTSASTGTGLEHLIREIGRRASEAVGQPDDTLPSRLRHVEEIEKAARAIDDAISADNPETELKAEYLRTAVQSLAKLVGTIDTEEVLGAIFSRFCIGK